MELRAISLEYPAGSSVIPRVLKSNRRKSEGDTTTELQRGGINDFEDGKGESQAKE